MGGGVGGCIWFANIVHEGNVDWRLRIEYAGTHRCSVEIEN